MATLYFLEYQKRSSLEWSAVASGGILSIGPMRVPPMQSTPNYDPKYNANLHSTLPPYLNSDILTKGLPVKTSHKGSTLPTQPPNTKQQLYSQEITWYPVGHPGSQPKHDKNR